MNTETTRQAARKVERQPVGGAPRATIMSRADVRARILAALRRNQYECDMEELVRACSSCTWNQVFLEVDRLTRTGELRLVSRGRGVYAVQLPAA
jgi:hypothetical protein